MRICIICFDDFTDIDVFLMWDLLKRVRHQNWQVMLLGERECHVSATGIQLSMHGHLSLANGADAVLFASGKGARVKIRDAHFLECFHLNEKTQLIGSICSGSLILAALGLLAGRTATTYPSAKVSLEGFGVEVEEKAFVPHGNVATAAGCLAAQILVGWVIERLVGSEEKDFVLRSIQPIGEGLSFEDDRKPSLP